MESTCRRIKKCHVETAEVEPVNHPGERQGDHFWNIGLDAPVRSSSKISGRSFWIAAPTNPRLTVLLKIDRLGKYEMMVNLIDEAERIPDYAIQPRTLLDQDKALLAKVSV